MKQLQFFSFAGIILLFIIFSSLISTAQSGRERILMNRDWRFTKADPADANSKIRRAAKSRD